MDDLTIVFYTANVVPDTWMEFVTRHLEYSGGNYPVISVSQKPLALGRNICVGEIGRSHLNIYRQMLTGAKAAETDYIAFVEDDALFPPEHFSRRPGRPDIAAYNMSKWALFTWMRPPCFNLFPPHHTNAGCIIGRELFIEAMEERFAKHPDDGRVNLSHWAEVGRYEANLRVTVREMEDFYTETPFIFVSHENALGYLNLGKRKRPGKIRASELPYWGKAADILYYYYGRRV